ncbi:MAG: amino acid permease, partial [Gammaproteobacteria bacterium]|nr:amino acid permease [Gammaproteobacteria bacterium]NIX84095.1 amino acid permease [Gammaproteobacteria bacterium]
LIAFGMISAVSAMAWTGSRVARTMGEDYRGLVWLARSRRNGVPHIALVWQLAVVLLLLLTASFEAVLVYLEAILILSSILTVVGLFVLRVREPDLPR